MQGKDNFYFEGMEKILLKVLSNTFFNIHLFNHIMHYAQYYLRHKLLIRIPHLNFYHKLCAKYLQRQIY